MTHIDQPINTRKAALYLGLSQYTLEAWRSRGDGPKYLKMGRSVRYRMEDLDAFIQTRTRKHTSQGVT